MNPDTKNNVFAYYLTQFLGNLSFTLPIYILFGKNYLGFSYSQIAFITLIAFGSSTAFDFILGIVADSVSRKKTYILGVILSLISFLPYLFSKEYPLFIIAAFISGIGSALTSNVLDTFIHEDLRRNNLLKEYPKVTAKAQQMLFFGRMCAGIIGGFIFTINPKLPYIGVVISTLLCLVLATKMFKEMIDSKENIGTKIIAKQAINFLKERKDIINFCLVGLFILIFGDLQFGYYQPYFNTLNINPALLGGLYSAISLFSAYGSHLMKSFLTKHSPKKINAFMIIATICTAVLMLPRIPILAFIAPLFIAVTFGFVYPNMRHFLNSQSPSKIKTSIASFGSTVYAIGTMVGLSSGGILADHFSSTIILSIIIAGSIVTLILNNRLQLKEAIQKS